MNTVDDFSETHISDEYVWFHKPDKFRTGDGLEIWTNPQTDFCQRTHYGFRNDNGHCRRGQDFLIESSLDGQAWQQLRICHLHETAAEVAAGIYACSPLENSFWCRFGFLQFAPNQWRAENH